MNNKLMDIYDNRYNENLSKMLNKGVSREEAKNLIGLIYKKTEEALPKKGTTREYIEEVFNKVQMQFGVC
jgi:hypothetical protein